ncbi:unnamed protein product [Sphacelaria rigidula]
MAEMGRFEGVAEVLRKHAKGRGSRGADAAKKALVAWLDALGCGEFLARFLTAGYDDLAFMASHGLAEADLDCIGVPHEKLGLRKKLLAMHSVHDFLPNTEAEKEEEEEIDSVRSSRSGEEGDTSASDDRGSSSGSSDHGYHSSDSGRASNTADDTDDDGSDESETESCSNNSG